MSKKYKVLTQVNFNNVDYPIDSPIELEQDVADPLLAVKAIELDESAPPPAPEGQERIDAIKAAIATLNVDVTENWTKAGAPTTEAIAAVTGWPVNAKERDAIWAELNPA